MAKANLNPANSNSKSPPSAADPSKKVSGSMSPLVVLGVIIWIALAVVTWLSDAFRLEGIDPDLRPIRLVVAIYITATLASIAAYFVASAIPRDTHRLTLTIVAFAIAFRVIQVFSTPILEIDHYRYMWDGIVVNSGVSPYRFSPKQVLEAAQQNPDSLPDPRLKKLTSIVNADPSQAKILSTIHFPEYTTLYPPVSQVVFAGAIRAVPPSSSPIVYLRVMKLFLVMFDIGVVLLLVTLCRRLEFHPAGVLAYAWNPLVIKEVANGAHLDSIAVFFVVAGLYCFVTSFQKARGNGAAGKASVNSMIWAGGWLGLGVGAKIFPVVLFPLLFWAAWSWKGLRMAIVFGAMFAAVAAVGLGSMLWDLRQIEIEQKALAEQANVAQATDSNSVFENQDAKQGLGSFLAKWRMNDVLFSLVYENTNPKIDLESPSRPWYVVTSQSFREQSNQHVAKWTKRAQPPFLLARIVTLSLFALAYLWALRKVSILKKLGPEKRAESLLELSFLVLAIFFFLQPTQNPWYWIWALPLVGFAKNWAWLFVSPMLFVYYLRFWFRGHSGEFSFFDFEYSGVGFFDHCVVWLEYLPVWLLWVVVRVLGGKKPD